MRSPQTWLHCQFQGAACNAASTASWDAALRTFRSSDFIAQYLGKYFRQAFSEIKQVEQAEFSAAVSLLEYDTCLVLA